jgi:tRNA1(Val) A37 N6-methylase TrmN6
VKGGRGGVQVDAPLVIYEREKKYTPEIEAMLAGSRSASVQKFKSSRVRRWTLNH